MGWAKTSPAQPMGQVFSEKKPWDGLGWRFLTMGAHGPRTPAHGSDINNKFFYNT